MQEPQRGHSKGRGLGAPAPPSKHITVKVRPLTVSYLLHTRLARHRYLVSLSFILFFNLQLETFIPMVQARYSISDIENKNKNTQNHFKRYFKNINNLHYLTTSSLYENTVEKLNLTIFIKSMM